MHRQNLIAAGLLVLLSALVVTAGYTKGLGPLGVINSGITLLTGGNRSDGLVPETKSIPIILCTSKSQETDKIWGMRQGARDYIVKPVNRDELLAKITAVA